MPGPGRARREGAERHGAPPPGKPWWSRPWVWLLAAPLVCCALGGVVAAYARLTIDGNPVYVAALQRAERNGTVRQRLGTPLTVTAVQSAQLSFLGGPTRLVLDVTGPKGSGTLVAVASGSEPESLEIFNMKLIVGSTREEIRLDGRSGSR